VPVYSSILTKVQTNLDAAAVNSGILEGFTVCPSPIAEGVGLDSVPAVRIQDWELQETYMDANPCREQLFIEILVSSKLEDGLPVHVLAVEKVLDAIECGASTPDPTLGGLLTKPFDVQTRNHVKHAVSIDTMLRIIMAPKACVQRGKRRL
jgi:hypothetical protein